MPQKDQYFVWRVEDGKKFTVVAHSTRGALKLFCELHSRDARPGEYNVKRRGDSAGWDTFRVG